MKVIDLLNKIANGEEVPKMVMCDETTYYYDETDDNELARYRDDNDVMLVDESYLNDEVEVIEEDKKIEKFTEYEMKRNMIGEWNMALKINEIIDKLNKGKE